jgi:hypothetical protein
MADRVGLTDRLSVALTRRGFVPGHARGQVWLDVATMLTAGGEAIADIDTLRHQEGVLGPVASAPTVWRTLNEATPVARARVERARAQVWRHVWDLLARLPASPVAGADLGEVVVLDVDVTLVTAHSEKEQARATFKGGFGFPPLGVWCDSTAIPQIPLLDELANGPSACYEATTPEQAGPALESAAAASASTSMCLLIRRPWLSGWAVFVAWPCSPAGCASRARPLSLPGGYLARGGSAGKCA